MKQLITILCLLLITTFANADIIISKDTPEAQPAIEGLLTTCATVSQERNSIKLDYRAYGTDANGERVYIGEPLSVSYDGWKAAYIITLFENTDLVKALQASTVYEGGVVSFNEETLFPALATIQAEMFPDMVGPDLGLTEGEVTP